MSKYWKKQTFTVFLAVSIMNVIGLTYIVYKGFQLSDDIKRVHQSAQAAPNAQAMHKLCLKLKQNLEKHGMTHGYAALFHKNSANNVGLYYSSVKDLINKLKLAHKYPAGSTRYNTALLDTRQSLAKMPAIMNSWIWSQWAWWILLICVLGWIVLFAAYFKYEAY